jgi:hypothetical protein
MLFKKLDAEGLEVLKDRPIVIKNWVWNINHRCWEIAYEDLCSDAQG